jgi:hypothetical protein
MYYSRKSASGVRAAFTLIGSFFPKKKEKYAQHRLSKLNVLGHRLLRIASGLAVSTLIGSFFLLTVELPHPWLGFRV